MKRKIIKYALRQIVPAFVVIGVVLALYGLFAGTHPDGFSGAVKNLIEGVSKRSTHVSIPAPVIVIDLKTLAPQDDSRRITDGRIFEYNIPAKPGKATPKPSITAASFVLMDANTAQILREYKPRERRPNASTTKIMTSVLAIENCALTDTITASKAASETPYTSIHLKPGEQISVKDVLAALLIRSANDASVAVAEHIAGTVPKFAAMMNEKALELGCENTNFVTPNGLHDPKHYSCAYDLCLMARHAMNYPIFNEMAKTKKYPLDSRTVNREDLVLFSRAKFLKNYPGADGVKSGYVKEAGQCYVGSATKSKWRLISAVLKSENVSEDTAALMDYGFGAFRQCKFAEAGEIIGQAPVRGGNRKTVVVAVMQDLTAVVPEKGGKLEFVCSVPQVRAPIAHGQTIGTITSMLDGIPIETTELHALQDVQISLLRKSGPYVLGLGILACTLLLVKNARKNSKNTFRGGIRVSPVLRNIDRRR